MNIKRIYLVRHGETRFNVEGIVQGRRIDSELNETGIIQRDLLAHKFLKIPIDHIYLSTLKRTYQTMKPIIDKGVGYSFIADLDELNFGETEGLPIFDSKGDSILREIIEKWRSGDYHSKFPGGESPFEALTRVERGFEKIIHTQNQNTIVVCLHQRILRIVMCHILQAPLSEMDQYPHHNTGVTSIDYDCDRKIYSVVELNNIGHLSLEKQI